MIVYQTLANTEEDALINKMASCVSAHLDSVGRHALTVRLPVVSELISKLPVDLASFMQRIVPLFFVSFTSFCPLCENVFLL